MAVEFRQYTYTSAHSSPEGMRYGRSSAEILQQLRAEWPVEELVTDAESDFDRLRRVRHWVHTRWSHDGWNEPSKSDPLTILREAADGKSFRCVEYSIVMAAVLTAIGIPGRTLGLMTADVEEREAGAAHAVTEAWLPDLGKWAMADGQLEVTPLANGVPLNGFELQQLLASDPEAVSFDTVTNFTERAEYIEWIGEYLAFLRVPREQRFDGGSSPTAPDLLLVPNELAPPAVFQRKYPIGRITVARSPVEIYAPPRMGG